jgi:hypothetical protein
MTLHEIPVTSPAWSRELRGPKNAFNAIADAVHQPDTVDEYLDRAIATHQDSTVRAAFLFISIERAYTEKNVARFAQSYASLSHEYPASPWADRMRNRYGPEHRLETGVPAPDVAFNGLEDSTAVLRPAA